MVSHRITDELVAVPCLMSNISVSINLKVVVALAYDQWTW